MTYNPSVAPEGEQRVTVGTVSGMTLAVVVESADLVVRLRDTSDAPACGMISHVLQYRECRWKAYPSRKHPQRLTERSALCTYMCPACALRTLIDEVTQMDDIVDRLLADWITEGVEEAEGVYEDD